MTSYPIKVMWPHEAIRARPGMYVNGPDRAAQARSLVELTLTRLSSPDFLNEASRVDLHVWPGPTFEVVDDGRGWPLDTLSVDGSPMNRIDRVMTWLHLGPVPFTVEPPSERGLEPPPAPQVWGPFGGFGAILNALCSRVLVQTTRDGTQVESRYSRGGIISPVHPLSGPPSRGTRVIFELDPLLFDATAQEYAAEKKGLEAFVSRHPTTTLGWNADEAMGWAPWQSPRAGSGS